MTQEKVIKLLKKSNMTTKELKEKLDCTNSQINNYIHRLRKSKTIITVSEGGYHHKRHYLIENYLNTKDFKKVIK